jgi:hypothetical protein
MRSTASSRVAAVVTANVPGERSSSACSRASAWAVGATTAIGTEETDDVTVGQRNAISSTDTAAASARPTTTRRDHGV